jgi:hypothetical protein
VAAHQATYPLDGLRGPDFRVTSFDGITGNFAEDRARRSIVLVVKLVPRGANNSSNKDDMATGSS